jgi:hypothetical protein
MAPALKSKKASKEARENQIILEHKFKNRITVVKFGKQSLDAGDYSTALRKFVEYLQTMAQVKNCHDLYSLRVSHFDTNKDITEMLMISHVFFEAARIYDAIPKFHEDSIKCLDQFVHFSANQPYQVVNSELVRKHLKKSLFKNPEAFRNAYQQIFVQSKKCYVVTFCYGDSHPITHEYRIFKDWLLKFSIGHELVRHYYRFSSVAVERWRSNTIFNLLSQYLICPLLVLFSKTLLRFIIK